MATLDNPVDTIDAPPEAYGERDPDPRRLRGRPRDHRAVRAAARRELRGGGGCRPRRRSPRSSGRSRCSPCSWRPRAGRRRSASEALRVPAFMFPEEAARALAHAARYAEWRAPPRAMCPSSTDLRVDEAAAAARRALGRLEGRPNARCVVPAAGLSRSVSGRWRALALAGARTRWPGCSTATASASPTGASPTRRPARARPPTSWAGPSRSRQWRPGWSASARRRRWCWASRVPTRSRRPPRR